MKLTNEQIAQVCYETNRAYCKILGDFSQPAWEDAPDWQKQSAINGVDFRVNNPYADPSASHENWRKVKEEEGWVYGPIKNPDKKEHPCMVPYGDLSPEQQAKDELFTAVVEALDYYNWREAMDDN